MLSLIADDLTGRGNPATYSAATYTKTVHFTGGHAGSDASPVCEQAVAGGFVAFEMHAVEDVATTLRSSRPEPFTARNNRCD